MKILCHVDDIPEMGARGFAVDGEKLLVAKKGGQVHLYRNSCPHTGVNLDWQPDDFMSFDQLFLQCSTHGALFQIEDGYCVSGPCQGRSLTAVGFKLVDGQVMLPEPESI